MISKCLLYIDPGSGSYLIQVIIAAILGISFFFKNLWWKFRSFFIKSNKSKEEDSAENDRDNA